MGVRNYYTVSQTIAKNIFRRNLMSLCWYANASNGGIVSIYMGTLEEELYFGKCEIPNDSIASTVRVTN